MNNNLIRLLGAALLVSSGLFVVSCGGGHSANDNKIQVSCDKPGNFDPSNPNQVNVCTRDADKDGIEDDVDNCSSYANSGQSDDDTDDIGDTCDTDDSNEICKRGKIELPPYNKIDMECSPVSVEPPTYCAGDTKEKYPVPASTNASRGKVRETQMIAAIMAYTTGGHPDEVQLKDYAQAAIRAARLANNKTEKWNDCAAEQAWDSLKASDIFTYKQITGEDSAYMRIYSNTNSVIVAFEGTNGAGDIFQDISSTPLRLHGVKFHGGVLNHWLQHKKSFAVRESLGFNGTVFDLINRYAPNPRDKDPATSKIVYFTGHSLGGAAANVALFDYVKTYGKSSAKFPQSYTFGASPIVENGDVCVWQTYWWHCENNLHKYEYTTAYGYRRNTDLKNLIHNFANVHAEDLKNDPVPHFFSLPKLYPVYASHKGYSHVGYHYLMRRNGDLITNVSSGSVTSGSVSYQWRIRSATDFKVKPSIGFLAPRIFAAAPTGQIPQHNTCFYRRSLEYDVDGSQGRWLNNAPAVSSDFECAYRK